MCNAATKKTMNQPIDVVHTNSTGKFIFSFYDQVQHKSDCKTKSDDECLKIAY